MIIAITLLLWDKMTPVKLEGLDGAIIVAIFFCSIFSAIETDRAIIHWLKKSHAK